MTIQYTTQSAPHAGGPAGGMTQEPHLSQVDLSNEDAMWLLSEGILEIYHDPVQDLLADPDLSSAHL